MSSSNDEAAKFVLLAGVVVLTISQVVNVPIPVAVDAVPGLVFWVGAVGLMAYLHMTETLWPVALGSIPWAISAILDHKYQGMWLGSEGGQNVLALMLMAGGYLFKLWRRPGYY